MSPARTQCSASTSTARLGRAAAWTRSIADELDTAGAEARGRFHQRQMIFGPCAVIQANDLDIPDAQANIAQYGPKRAAQRGQFIAPIDTVGRRGWREPQIDEIESRIAGDPHQLFRSKRDQAQMRER